MQISEQIRYMIISNHYPVGTQLPSSRDLSEIFAVNRNTIKNAIDILANEGLVEARRGLGVFVVKNISDPGARVDLTEIANRAYTEAKHLGYSGIELLETLRLLVSNDTQNSNQGREQAFRYMVFVECNTPSLEVYKNEIETLIKVNVEPLLLSDLEKINDSVKMMLDNCECVVTTYTHLNYVRDLLKFIDKPIIAITAVPYIDLWMNTAKWSRDDRIGVVMVRKYGAECIVETFRDSKLKFNEILATGLDDPDMKKIVKGSDKLIVSSQAIDAVKKILTGDQEYVVYENHLDEAGLELIKKYLNVK